ncbi:MAG: hypothetical protein ACJ748_05545 [Flavisolibacter sp.]
MNSTDEKAISTVQKPVQKEESKQMISEKQFSIAVAEALKYLDNPKKLLKSPLLLSRFYKKEALEDNEIHKAILLTDAIIKNINRFEYSVKYQSYFRLLYRTYINPVGTQMETADFLCLSFSTYRRQLKNAIQWIADILWVEEKRLCLNLQMN